MIPLPPGQTLAGLGKPSVALSPDGTELAYIAQDGSGPQQIYRRLLDGIDAQPVAGTEGATGLFFSPDGRRLGFFVDGKLKVISVDGGTARSIADLPNAFGATWTDRHTIVVAPYTSALEEVPEDGEPPHPLTHLGSGETLHRWPLSVPGANAVLFTAFSGRPTAIGVQRLGEDSRTREDLHGVSGDMPAYAPSGHLVYAQDGGLMAVPFDAVHLLATGSAVPVQRGVMQSALSGAAQYSLSMTGTLAYIAGGTASGVSMLVWVDRHGTAHPVQGAQADAYNQPRLAPDGSRIAVDILENASSMQVWLYDVAGRRLTRFTFGGVNRHGLWRPDGRGLVFMSDRAGPTTLFWQPVDGSSGPKLLVSNARDGTALIPYSWTADARQLSFAQIGTTAATEGWVLRLDDPAALSSGRGGTTTNVADVRLAVDGAPTLSPDGRWLAYATEEGGRREVYLQAYPGPGPKRQVSDGGGNEPLWNPNGRELFYRQADRMMSVAVDTTAGLDIGAPRVLFTGRFVTAGVYARPNYDVSQDGQRFLMLQAVAPTGAPPSAINIVLNWSEELKRLVPPAAP
jgi:serine/threonine-protein kinase